MDTSVSALKPPVDLDLMQVTGKLAETHTARPNGQSPDELRKAAQEFEGYFIAYLMKIMRETVPSGLFENKEGKTFYSFYDQEIGRLAAQGGGLGLGKMWQEGLNFSPLSTEEKDRR